jgi:lactocepin
VSRAKTYVAKPKITNNYSGLTGILKVKWKSIRNANKYEIYQYKNSKWKKVRTTTSLSFFLYADKGKTYKFKIRAYTTVMKHKIYSKFAQITRKI